MKQKLKVILLVLLSAKTLAVFADSNSGVSKQLWLEKFKPAAPSAMCEAIMSSSVSSKLMKTKNITYEQCIPLIAKSLDKCLEKYTTLLPEKLTVEDGKKWGRELGRCSGEDFYNTYLSK